MDHFLEKKRIHKDLRKISVFSSHAAEMSDRFEGSSTIDAQRSCQATCSCSKSLDLWWKIQSLPGQDLDSMEVRHVEVCIAVIMMKRLPRLVN